MDSVKITEAKKINKSLMKLHVKRIVDSYELTVNNRAIVLYRTMARLKEVDFYYGYKLEFDVYNKIKNMIKFEMLGGT
jgi:hypothetical protein